MIPGLIPQDKLVFIWVHQGRARVARYVQTDDYTFQVEVAENWEALEKEALQAVVFQAGVPIEEHYPCPPELVGRAEWS